MTAEQMALAKKMMDTVDLMIDPIQGVPPMRTTARGMLTALENEMRMQEGERITKPIPWYVIVWEEGTIHLESTIITTDRDMALLQAGADLASIGEDVALAECQVSARPAV